MSKTGFLEGEKDPGRIGKRKELSTRRTVRTHASTLHQGQAEGKAGKSSLFESGDRAVNREGTEIEKERNRLAERRRRAIVAHAAGQEEVNKKRY